MSRFVFVESNTTGTGQIAVQRLTEAGHEVTFLTRSREKYPFLAQPGERLEVIGIETNDAAAVARSTRDLGERSGVDAILTFSEFYVEIVAEVAAQMGLRYLSPQPARTCRNKFVTREVLRRAGLPTPDFHLVGSAEEARCLAPALTFPCVVKPPADSSSYGVRAVRDIDELVSHVRTLAAERENVRGQRLDGTILIESYLEGPEFSVETVTLPDGPTCVVGVTDKHLSPPPSFVETGHDFPTAAESHIRTALVDATLAALAAVGFDFGPAHTEVRWTASGPVVIEINPRLAGGMIPELVKYATGLDLLDILINLLLGHRPALEPSRSEVASIRFFTADRAGRIAGLHGIEQAERLPTVRQVHFGKQVGARVQPAENAYHRLGFVIGAGSDRLRVRTDLERALELISIEIDPSEAHPPA